MLIFNYPPVVQGYDYQTIFPDPSNTREVLSPIDTDGEGRYDHKQDILWRLYARVNRVLTIYITYMDIQWGENCEFDSLQVSNNFILLIKTYTGEKDLSLPVSKEACIGGTKYPISFEVNRQVSRINCQISP